MRKYIFTFLAAVVAVGGITALGMGSFAHADTNTSTTQNNPTIPGNLSVSHPTASSMDLTWNPSTVPNVTAPTLTYTLYRNGTAIGTTTGNTTTFTDKELSPNTQYSYTITATDANGNNSGQSAAVTGNTEKNTSLEHPWGYIVLPLTTYTTSLGHTTTTDPAATPNTAREYMQLNGNYLDCNGNIDNDMIHHSTDPNDTDPGHHIGMNCSMDMHQPWSWNSMYMTNQTNNSHMVFTDQNNTQWIQVPLTPELVSELQTYFTKHPATK